MPYPLRRWGGNSVTRYNWQKDATNHASDWFFINLPEGPDSTGLPDGSTADLWVDETLAAGAEAIVTDSDDRLDGARPREAVGLLRRQVRAQQETECTASGWPSWCEADAGNGVRLDGSLVTGNDPHDTSVEIGPSFAPAGCSTSSGRFGSAQAGGVAFYALDNEPMLWNSTHRDVHPHPATLDELWADTQSYAEAIKAVDPAAAGARACRLGMVRVLLLGARRLRAGPGHGRARRPPPARVVPDEEPRARAADRARGRWTTSTSTTIPQANGVALTDDESVAALRLRSLKSLYDPSYVDESWIGQPVRLIPRLKEWIAARCPG